MDNSQLPRAGRPPREWARLGDYYRQQREQEIAVEQLAQEVSQLEHSPPSTVRARWREQAMAETAQAETAQPGGEWRHASRASRHVLAVASREAEAARGRAATRDAAQQAEAARLARWAAFVERHPSAVGQDGQPKSYDPSTPPTWFE